MRVFSPEKANALIPKVAPLMEELWGKRRDLAIRLLENDPVLHGGPAAGASRLASPRSPFAPGRFAEQKAEIVRIINRIETYGCIVKDIDIGTIDFPSIRDGRAIYLCWRTGEERVEHWHAIDEGFANRKAL